MRNRNGMYGDNVKMKKDGMLRDNVYHLVMTQDSVPVMLYEDYFLEELMTAVNDEIDVVRNNSYYIINLLDKILQPLLEHDPEMKEKYVQMTINDFIDEE